MQEIVLVIHVIFTASLVILVLIQKSEGGALGMGGGGQGGMMTGRGSANILTKMTTFLAIGFFATCLTLAVMAKQQSEASSVFDVEETVVEETEQEEKPEPVIPDSN